MKKNLLSLILALVLLTVSFAAVAEEVLPERVPGNFPERGIVLPMTDEDAANGLNGSFQMAATAEVNSLPIFDITYIDNPSLEAVFSKLENATEEESESEDFLMNVLIDMLSCSHSLYTIALFENDYIAEKRAGDGMIDEITSLNDLTFLAENDGYSYFLINTIDTTAIEDAELKARIDAAAVRGKELLDAMTYQPVVFAEGEVTVAPDVFPAFETQDLSGNTVNNDIFSGKDLTVINIWGTFCNPCIDEMPELAAWSAEMPENVQIIGLVSDLYSADDAEVYELAKAICEATGAEVYTHLIAGEDFAELLSGVVGVPTTLFVDGMGNLVAEPVVGANVPLCQKTVSDYLSNL